MSVALALATGPARAASVAAPDEKAIDAKYRAASERFEEGEFLEAAREWSAVGEMYPEEPAYRKARARIFKDVAESYDKVMKNGGRLEVAREAVTVLDAYAERFAAAYGEAPGGRIAEVREALRAQVDAADAAARAQAAAEGAARAQEPARPEPTPGPAPRWRGLMAGGGVLLGGGAALLGALAGGLVLARQAEAYVEDPAHGCYPPLEGTCAQYDARGGAANGLFVAGAVGAPVMLAAGAAMVAIAAKRRAAGRSQLAPVLSRSLVGLAWVVRM